MSETNEVHLSPTGEVIDPTVTVIETKNVLPPVDSKEWKSMVRKARKQLEVGVRLGVVDEKLGASMKRVVKSCEIEYIEK